MTEPTYTGEAMSFRKRLPEPLAGLVRDLSDQRTRFAAFQFSGWLIGALEAVSPRKLVPGPEYIKDEKVNARRELALSAARSAHELLEWYQDMGCRGRLWVSRLLPTRAEYGNISASLRDGMEFLRQEDVVVALNRAMEEAKNASDQEVDLPARKKERFARPS